MLPTINFHQNMKWINKTNLRKIRIGKESYLWKRGHYHLDAFEYSQCVEKVIVFLNGYKNSPLHLLFKEEDNHLFKSDLEKEKWCVGHPEQGVIWLYKPEADLQAQRVNININLNRPAVIARLIEHYAGTHWNPRKTNKPLVIEDALRLVEELELPKEVHTENKS